MGKFTTLLCAAVLCSSAAAVAADEPAANAPAARGSAGIPAVSAAAAASGQTLSPEVQAAIGQLSADDYKTREAALTNLQMALGRQMQALVSSEDPEVQARLASLLQFNDGLTRWVLDTFKLPAEQRKATLDFGLSPEVLPILALVFSSDAQKRVEGIHKLGKIDKPQATVLLGRLLTDPDRAVYVAAMEAVWDRKPDEVIVDALWDRAVAAGMASMYGGRMVANQEKVSFRGKTLDPINVYDSSFMLRWQDAGVACEVLLHLKPAQLHDRLKDFLDGFAKVAEGKGDGNIWMYNSNESGKNGFRLAEAYPSKDLAEILLKVINGQVLQRSQGAMGNEKYFWSNRTVALATLVSMVGQKAPDYDLKQSKFMQGMWTTPTEADEDAAVKKINAWWSKNGASFGGKEVASPAKGTAATEPAAEKAGGPANVAPNVPPQGANVGPRVQVQQVIQGKLMPGAAGQIHIQIEPAPTPDK